MPAGEAFTEREAEDIRRALRVAEQVSGLAFSVYVGNVPGEDARSGARELHAQLPDPARSVLLTIDPGARTIEVVTGSEAVRRVDDRSCSLATMSMSSAFAGGDLAGGIAEGVRMLGDHAHSSRRR
ncbi:DUF5130 family protein [Vallicoccus soli]|uniref:DUF5130 family protein n=1 Tax=Vallicoccus soli TaxID=2339232 RepID=A0A3A3Z334_9ACTN|nr:DUF5130 family protein [Vallicoccus soli]